MNAAARVTGRSSPRHSSRHPAGFTLVDLLVSVGLTGMMMTLFTSVFLMATQAMTVQKGLAQNDQKIRLVLNILRNDLNGDKFDKADSTKPRTYRTFRKLIPFGAHENGELNFNDADRCGYFYISENDPDSDLDDCLQLTVCAPDAAAERFYGRTATVLPDTPDNCGLGNILGVLLGDLLGPAPGEYWPNQPEFDDIQGTPNGIGSSPLAEVSYFLRNGNLYRRVMLVRKPNVPNPPDDAMPLDLLGNALSLDYYENSGSRNFYTDFDYSTFCDRSGIRFHGCSSLNWNGSALSLANPAYRFGFDCTSKPGKGWGKPREHVGSNYIGRFTHEETSNPWFNYPGRVADSDYDEFVNPMSSSMALGFANGVVTDFAGGPRTGEDLLVSDVHGFDIKVWDPAASAGPDGLPGVANFDDDGINGVDDAGELGAPGSDDGAFRDLGHRGQTGFYRYVPAAQRLNNYYANSDTGHNRYDSWAPNLDLDGDGTYDAPPFRPIWIGPDRRPGKAHVDDDGINGVDDAGELGFPGSDDFAPLSAIQIKIRFYDPSTNQLRETTAIFSLAYCP